MTYPGSASGLVHVHKGGAPVAPRDAFAFAAAESLRAEIEAAIAPFTAEIRAHGGSIVVDLPPDLGEAEVTVYGLPAELTAEILARI